MTLDDPLPLTTHFGIPHEIEADRDLWVVAALIAGIRTASNSRRASRRNRGGLGNLVNDLQGTLGELALLRELEGLAGWGASHHLVDWAGGASEATKSASDLRLERAAEAMTIRNTSGAVLPRAPIGRPAMQVTLDAKSHLHATPELRAAGAKPKRDLAINHGAALMSLARGSRGVLEVLAAPGRVAAWVSRLLPLEDVLCWDLVDYGYGDPALAAPLLSVAPGLWGAPWKQLEQQLEASKQVITLDTLRRIHAGAIKRFDILRHTLDLATRGYSDIVDNAIEPARECYEASAP
jgi:hypothetical protein